MSGWSSSYPENRTLSPGNTSKETQTSNANARCPTVKRRQAIKVKAAQGFTKKSDIGGAMPPKSETPLHSANSHPKGPVQDLSIVSDCTCGSSSTPPSKTPKALQPFLAHLYTTRGECLSLKHSPMSPKPSPRRSPENPGLASA